MRKLNTNNDMRFVFVAIFYLTLVTGVSGQFKPVDEGSSIEFHVKHFGIETSGTFSGMQGSITFDSQSLSSSKFDVSIDAATIHTGMDIRDDHLRGDGYFEAAKYPRIRFISSKIISNESGLMAIGQLTMKDKTMEVSIPFTATPVVGGYVFTGSFKVSRRDYGVGGPGVISDTVDVLLKISAAK
jgi:polyisoprenoid-binding protein YceI